jgi:hypothetical protein
MDPTCFKCGEPFFGGSCVWCACNECDSDIRDGFCWDFNSPTYDQRFFNNPSNVPDYYTPPPLSFNCYNCGNLSEEGVSCGQCFCNQCGYINCICYAPSAETSYACDSSFDNYPQNDFNLPSQNFYEQVPYYNDNSFQNSSNFENCGGSFENFYYEPNSCYDSHGFNQPPQTPNMVQVSNEVIDEMKSPTAMVREFMVNRFTYTPDPNEKTMGELLAEERSAKLRKTFIHDDDDEDSIQIGGFYTSSAEITPVKEEKSMAELLAEEQMKNIRALYFDQKVDKYVPEISDSSPSGNPTPSSDPLISDSFHPSLESVERSDVFLDEIEACLANDSIPIIDDANFDPEGDIRLLEELLNAEPSTSLPPINNEDLVEVESYTDSHNEYTTSNEDSCGDIDDMDEEDDTEIQDEALREKLSKVYLLISKIEALNDPPISSPIPVMDSDFLPELEIFRFEETSSGSPTIHADISLPDYECFHFEIDSTPISDNPSRNPLLEDVDLFLAAEDSIPPGIENDEYDISFDSSSSRPPAKPPDVDCECDTNEEIFGVVDEISEQDVPVLKILPTQPTLDSEIDFAFIIWVFYPFFAYPILSSLFHSTGSEDTVFDTGIFYAGCPFHLLSPRTN